MQSVQTLDSQVGTFTIPLPKQIIQRGQKFYTRIKVSEAQLAREGVSDEEQDDEWKINSLQLTLKGARAE